MFEKIERTNERQSWHRAKKKEKKKVVNQSKTWMEIVFENVNWFHGNQSSRISMCHICCVSSYLMHIVHGLILSNNVCVVCIRLVRVHEDGLRLCSDVIRTWFWHGRGNGTWQKRTKYRLYLTLVLLRLHQRRSTYENYSHPRMYVKWPKRKDT